MFALFIKGSNIVCQDKVNDHSLFDHGLISCPYILTFQKKSETMRTTDPELHKKRKLQIVEAASRCFVERGFHKSSMREICQEAGMSPGNLYRYFKSKEEIIRAAADAESDYLLCEMKKLGQKGNIVEALTETAMLIIEEYNNADQARFIAEIYAEAARNATIGDCFAHNDKEIRKGLTELLKTAKSEGQVNLALPALDVAQAILALIDGYSTRILLDPTFKPKKTRKTIQLIIENLVQPQ